VDTEKLARAFVELADTLVADFDVHDVLHVLVNRCAELLGAVEAGLLLADDEGRLRGRVLGALNLFGTADGDPIRDSDVPVAQAMADVATIAILQDRLARERELLAVQLQYALDSRVVIEQAKGVLSTRLDIDMDEAFERIRKRARDSRRRLAEISEEVVSGAWTHRR
jgi:ANTAR domain